MRDALIEQIAFESGGEDESVEAAPAAVRKEPPGVFEAQGFACAAQHEAFLAYAGGCPVLEHDRDRPHLARRLRGRIREVSLLGQLELERARGLLCADMHQRMPWFPDPRVRDRGDVLARGFIESAPEVVGRSVGFGVPSKVYPHALAESLLAEVSLDHAEDRRAFRVRDRVETLRRFLGALRLDRDRVG